MANTYEAYMRYVEYYLTSLGNIENELTETSDNPGSILEKYDLDAQHISRAEEWAYRCGTENILDGDLCLQFSVKGPLLGTLRQNPSLRIKYLELALSYAEQKDLSEHVVYIQNLLGVAYNDSGDFSRSAKFYKKGLDKLRTENNQPNQEMVISAYLGNLGGTYTRLGDYHKAESCFREALEISQQTNSRQDELIDLSNLGSVLVEQGKTTEALSCYQRASTLANELADKQSQAAILLNLGQAYGQIGDLRCFSCLEAAKQIFKEHLKNHPDFPLLLLNLGNMYADTKEYEKAISYYQQALDLSQKTEDVYTESIILTSLGSAYLNLKIFDTALECHFRGLKISQTNGYTKNMSICLGNIGNIYYKTNRYQEAIEFYQQAIELNPDGNGWNLHIWFSNLAKVYKQQDHIDKAISALEEATQIATKLGLKSKKREYQVDLSDLLLARKDFHSALPHLQSLLENTNPEDHSQKYSVLNQIIHANMMLENVSNTVTYRKQAITIAKKHLEKADIIYQLGELANAFGALELNKEALDAYFEILSLEPDLETKGLTLSNIGTTQYLSGKRQEAMKAYELALNIFENLNDQHHSLEVQQYINLLVL